MRQLMGLSIVICAVLALAIGTARGVGRVTARDPFPIPNGRGCWQGVCPFVIPTEQLPDTVALVPGTSVHGGYRMGDINTLGQSNVLVSFDYTYAGRSALPLVLSISVTGYSLLLDTVAAPPGSALMSVGDLMVTLGLPDSVQFGMNDVWLLYPEMRLAARVRALGAVRGPVRVALDSGVTGFQLIAPDVPFTLSGVAWNGLREYDIDSTH